VSEYIMKAIYVIFEDKEHKQLSKTKGKLSWREFILKLLKGGVEWKQ